MKKILIICKFAIILSFLFSTNLWAAVIYVDNGTIESGSSWDGTNGHSYVGALGTGKGYSTIMAAVDAMSGGDDIYLRSGTYNEHDIYISAAKSGSAGDWSSMQSYPGEWAIINGQWNCTRDPNAVISNGSYAGHDTTNVAKYWLFERLEITGGGRNTVVSDTPGFGIYWNFGPWKMRYCYVHDNIGPWAEENPAGIGGITWQNAVIEYNYVKDNRSAQGYGNNVFNIAATATYVEYSNSYNANYNLWKNEIRYNLVQGQAGGIRTKGAAWLTSNRTGTDTTNKQYGDKIHHNIVIQTNNSSTPAIFYQQDYAQIYNNIVDQGAASKGQENWSIATRRIRSSGQRDILQTAIYNNTIYNGASEIADFHEGDGSANEEWYVYNNVLDKMSYVFCPITYGCSSGWCSGYSDRTSQDKTKLYIDRNYIYRTDGTDDAIYIGNASWPTGRYTAATWESAKGGGVNMYAQSYDSSNLLYEGTTGANKYKTRGAHRVEGTTVLSAAGIGGNHPYLAGVTIPSYISATNPSDNNWVEGVLGLATVSNLMSGTSTAPSWIEGSTTPPVSRPPATVLTIQTDGN